MVSTAPPRTSSLGHSNRSEDANGSPPRAGTGAIVVSFFTDEPYYRDAAERLRRDCTNLGVDCEIAPRSTSAEHWIDACRGKIPFLLEMHRKHQRPILWLDADSRLARMPPALQSANCDFAAFLRGFRYLRDFDPVAMPRFFAPFALYFNFTSAATAFLELMAELESKHTGSATDDFFLQEAWKRHREQLTVTVLPPDLVGHEWPLTERQAIYVGISGNVSKFKGLAEQHTPPLFAPEHRKAVLAHEGRAALDAGRIDEGLLLYQCALAASPDDELAAKVARLLRRHGRTAEAERVLATHAGSAGAAPEA